MLESFLSKLGASTKITIGVSVSPGIGLEMIEVDRALSAVSKYANRPLDYNFSTREIMDYDQFETALEELFEELHIPKRSNIILNIPNVHFGMINLPILLTDEAITNAIISEVEQSYIFKRLEPVVSWTEIYSNVETENRTLAYTALQENALTNITERCSKIGCTLIKVENSYLSLLKTLHFSGLTKDQMKENSTWNLMVIGQNSYSILSMFEKKIMEYYEEPLALKSFVDDEIYNAIISSSQLTLAGLPANNLLIVSETDLVSAEVLSLKLNMPCSVNFLECNKFAQNEIIPVNLNVLPNVALQITPEAIGAGIYSFSDFPLKLNMMDVKSKDSDSSGTFDIAESPRITVGGLEIELTPSFIKRVSVIFGAVFILPIFILNILLGSFVLPKEQAKLDDINSRISTTNAEIEKYTKKPEVTAFDLTSAINNIVKQNTAKLDYYVALGVSIPNRLWITYYSLSGSGKVDIKGQATDVKSVYAFYKNFKGMINNSDVKLYKLEIDSSSIDSIVGDSSTSAKIYNFEITNMTEEELNPPKVGDDKSQTGDNQNQQGQDNQQGQQGASDQKPLFQIGKPLFGQGGNNSSDSSTPPATSTTPSGGELPKNLEKIEKF